MTTEKCVKQRLLQNTATLLKPDHFSQTLNNEILLFSYPNLLNCVCTVCNSQKQIQQKRFPYQPFLGSLMWGLAPKFSSCSTTPEQPRPDATIKAVAWVSEC